MRVSPRFFTSSASFSSQFACELSLWHQHGSPEMKKEKQDWPLPQVASTSRKQTDSEHHCESALCLKCKMVRIQENSGYPGCSTHAPPMGTCALASKHDAHSAKSLYVTSLAPKLDTLLIRFRSMFSCFCLQKLSSRFFSNSCLFGLSVVGRSSASGVSGQLHTVASCQAPGDPSHWTTASDNSWQYGTKNRPTLLQRVASPALSHQSINHQSHPSFAARIMSSLMEKMGRKMHCHIHCCHILLEQLQIVAISNVRVTSMVLLLIWTSLKLPLIGGAFSKSRPNQIIQIQLWMKWSNKAITPKAIKPLPSAKNFSRTYVGVSRRSWLWCDCDCKECRWSHQLQGVIGDSWRSILPKSESCNSGSIDRRQCQKQERWSGLRWGCECFGYIDFTALALCKSLEWEIET